MEGLYLIQKREFVRLGEDVYKVGRSDYLPNRINDYDKGSIVKFTILCKKSIECEKMIIEQFKKEFTRKEYGLEYFEGDHEKMIEIMKEVVMKVCDIKDITYLINIHRYFSTMSKQKEEVSKEDVEEECSECEEEYDEDGIKKKKKFICEKCGEEFPNNYN